MVINLVESNLTDSGYSGFQSIENVNPWFKLFHAKNNLKDDTMNELE